MHTSNPGLPIKPATVKNAKISPNHKVALHMTPAGRGSKQREFRQTGKRILNSYSSYTGMPRGGTANHKFRTAAHNILL